MKELNSQKEIEVQVLKHPKEFVGLNEGAFASLLVPEKNPKNLMRFLDTNSEKLTIPELRGAMEKLLKIKQVKP